MCRFKLHETLESGGGSRKQLSPWLNLQKQRFFTMILFKSENSIRNIRPFCRPMFCHSSVVNLWSILHLSYSSERIMWLDCQILLKSPPLKLLAGPAPISRSSNIGTPLHSIFVASKQWRIQMEGVRCNCLTKRP